MADEKHRRSIRLPDYDYGSAGAYYITICTSEKAFLFTEERFVDAVDVCWQSIPDHFPYAGTDAFVVMPNHVHGVLWILDDGTSGDRRDVGAQRAPPLRRGLRLAPGSLGVMVRSFKAAVTKRVNEMRGTPSEKIWQRNYYEHVVRNDDELNRIREYIQLNPAKWNVDPDNPGRAADKDWDAQWAWLEGESRGSSVGEPRG